MQNNLSKKEYYKYINNISCNNTSNNNLKKFSLESLYEVENLLTNFSKVCKGIKIYKIFKD